MFLTAKKSQTDPNLQGDQILLLEIVYAEKIKRKGRTESSDQAVEEKGSH